MRILSDIHNGNHVCFIPYRCVVCGKIVFLTQHTVYGHLFVCPEHSDEELKDTVENHPEMLEFPIGRTMKKER